MPRRARNAKNTGAIFIASGLVPTTTKTVCIAFPLSLSWKDLHQVVTIRLEVKGMKIGDFSFGKIQINGKTYHHDVVIDHRDIRKRDKEPSKLRAAVHGHTPLTIDEDIPWDCKRLIIGTGANGSLPVLDEISKEAHKRGIELIMVPTKDAIKKMNANHTKTNAILHVTC
jgi:hypothetical protein